ncbi:MAG TPA: GDP-mannose 4,6-dehydratase [Thermoanaerobaculia bacterium]|jgi:GDP-4-dehydro-6-deoxy-D-mannose reductase|nr:GDP-mannose 4,6-dehydratase [Thermoanaerobaculia bacterium]
MRVLITGVGGFVGLRLARHLLKCGDRVSGTYIGAAPELPAVDLYPADLVDRPALERAVAAAEPDVIINLAGLSHIGDSWREKMPDYFWVNFVGTENLLAVGAGRRVIVVSSADVYGEVPEDHQPIPESRSVSPRSPYAITKAAAERLAFAAGAVVARSFNLIGPGQAPGFVLPSFAAQLAAIARGEREPVLRVGNLSARRDFVHVDDGVAAYRILAEKGEPGTAYNIASGRALSVEEVLHRLMDIAGVSAQIATDPEKFRAVDLPLLRGDASRLRTLGWETRRSVDDALTDLWKEVDSGL